MKELRRVMQEVETKAQGPGDARHRRKAHPAGDDGAQSGAAPRPHGLAIRKSSVVSSRLENTLHNYVSSEFPPLYLLLYVSHIC